MESLHLWDLELVKFLTSDPSVNVNWGDPEFHRTAFFRACGHNSVAVLPKVDVNKPNIEGATPFFIACQNGHEEVVSLLLADMRIDINMPDNGQCTPLWTAS